MGLRSFLGGDGVDFDPYGAFVPEHLPDADALPAEARVLDGREHCAVHRLARGLFEERGVYDVTFGYNLARLNLDPRHPGAGYRYAVSSPDGRDERVLWAAFTPTTPFCPQTDTLTVGSFRAWNGLSERHEFDLVRVRVADSHQRSEAVNDRLDGLAGTYRETGSVPEPEDATATPTAGGGHGTRSGGDDAPF